MVLVITSSVKRKDPERAMGAFAGWVILVPVLRLLQCETSIPEDGFGTAN